MRVGIAGLGKMGVAMAARLRDTGEEVIVWNRSPGRGQASSLPVAFSPRDLAERCDAVVTTVFDAAAVRQVFDGPDGLLQAAQGKLFVEMSTVRPEVHERLAEEVVRAGGAFVECPVGGTTGPARAGQLLGLAGGTEADVARARPLLQKLCSSVEHVGPVGAGASVKLAINLPLIVFWQSFGEALALVRHLGKEPDWLVELFARSAGGPNVLKARAAAVGNALGDRAAVEPTFDVDAMRKDLQTMLEEADASGLSLPVAAQARVALDEASSAGLGGSDCSCASAYWARRRPTSE